MGIIGDTYRIIAFSFTITSDKVVTQGMDVFYCLHFHALVCSGAIPWRECEEHFYGAYGIFTLDGLKCNNAEYKVHSQTVGRYFTRN